MTGGPKRIQLSRKAGWRKPEGAVVVSRPSKWGNPYKVGGGCTAEQAVEQFRSMLDRAPLGDGKWGSVGETAHQTIRRELRGHDLACWCKIGQPCHGDVLLDIANTPVGGGS